jgi:hypothetical protein
MNATTYRAWLLRLWREPDAAWRAALEDPRTGQRLAFASLDKLAEFVAGAGLAELANAAPPPTCPLPALPPDDATEEPDWESSGPSPTQISVIEGLTE